MCQQADRHMRNQDSSDKESYLGFIIKNKRIIMIEISLVLKQILGILCLLFSYSKFTLLSFYFLLTYFRYNHIIMIETGFLSSKILFAHRWRLISDRLENIVRSPEASNKCPARKFRPCRMAGLIL